MNNRNKGKAKNILAWCSLPLILLLTYCLDGYATFHSSNYVFSNNIIDTPPPIIKNAKDSLKFAAKKKVDTLRVPRMNEERKPITDTVFTQFADTFTFKRSKDTLSSPVVYHADDSMVIDVPAEKMYLYGKVSSVKYEDNNLSAPLIEFDNKTSIVSAFLVKDSTGKVTSYPYFTQADLQTVSDTIRFNMKNGKGITKGTYTKQGEIFVYADKLKKADTSSFYAFRTRFTTCNLDTPHFAFISKKAKFVNKKWAYTGPVHPEFEGVPLPISLPFGIFPLTQGRHSGLLAPSFTADEQRGLALENLGYYKIISQNWDVITRGTLYSYGSWKLDINPRYYRRYHYQGNLGLSVQNFKPLDAPKTTTYDFTWTHSADNKARPGVGFTANVHVASTKFNAQRANSPQQNFDNQLQSSISYTKDWSKKNKPYNISINANHNQNSVNGLTNLNLPDVAFNINTQYPFRKKESTGEIKWYENIGIGYQGNSKTLTSFYDTARGIGGQIVDNLKYGAQHNIPITLSLPPLGVIQISPSVSYQETWFQQKLVKSYNAVRLKDDTISLKKGLYTTRQVSFGVGASTRIFGMFGFGKNSKVKAIRHEIRPSLSLNYTPNVNEQNYYYTKVSATETRQVSYFENSGIYSPYSNIKNGGMSFGIDNNVTMKVRGKGDTSAAADKKITLLDGLSINSSYNFLADSFQLAPISVSARTNLFEKVNISAGASFNPYQIDAQGRPKNRLVLKDKFSLGNLTSANVSLQTSFKGGDKSKKTATEKLNQPNNGLRDDGITQDEYQREAAYVQNNPAEFADFEIPWNIDLSYSLTLNKNFDIVQTKFTSIVTQGITFNAAANLTPKWKIGANGSYNLSDKKLGLLSMYLTRDLHCWQMAINITPVGLSRSFSINIAPKSPILRDLKVNRTRSFTDF
jgi:LPS-assembly protein